MTVCHRCEGEGVIPVGGHSINPSSGVAVLDPQQTREETCPQCKGTGRAGCRLFVNRDRTILVTLWPEGGVQIATRDERDHLWGPPVDLREET